MSEPGSSETIRSRSLEAGLLFGASAAVFALAIASLGLGLEPVASFVKLTLFGLGCAASLAAMALALSSLHTPTITESTTPGAGEGTAQPPSEELAEDKGEDRGKPPAMRTGSRRAGAAGRTLFTAPVLLACAMLMTAASATMRQHASPLPLAAKTTVVIAPHIDARGMRIALGGSGESHAGGPSFLEDVVANALGSTLGNGVSHLADKILESVTHGHLTVSPKFYFGKGGTFSVKEITKALERAHLSVSVEDKDASTPPARALTDCARYYGELDGLADDEPEVVRRWPAAAFEAQAQACGFATPHALVEFIAYLARR